MRSRYARCGSKNRELRAMTSEEEEDLIRAIQERVTIVEYDPTWPLLFAEESERIRSLCGVKIEAIEHIGSTSVPGLPAKPIIDIAAAVQDSMVADELLEILCANGYHTSAEFNSTLGDRRWLMRQHGGRRTHHLHLLPVGALDWTNKIRFRNILRKHAEVKAQYLELKRRLAEEFGGERETYSESKTDFIQLVLQSRLEE